MEQSKKQKTRLQDFTEETVEIRAMVNYLRQLSSMEYEVLIRYLSGFSISEISGTVGLSPEKTERITAEIRMELYGSVPNREQQKNYFNDRER